VPAAALEEQAGEEGAIMKLIQNASKAPQRDAL
jgi:hypothetical protein